MKVSPKDGTISLVLGEFNTLEQARRIAATVAALPHPAASVAQRAEEARNAIQAMLAALNADQQPKEQ